MARPDSVRLRHGTTLHRAKSIEANGPDVHFREPGGTPLPPAEAFSAAFTDGRPFTTGTAESMAFEKAKNFPNEGGPAIIEFDVPQEILDILLADTIMAGFAQGGEARFERGFGIEELCAEWPRISKRVYTL